MQRSIISRSLMSSAVVITALSVSGTAWAQMGVDAHRPADAGAHSSPSRPQEDMNHTNMPGNMSARMAQNVDEIDVRLSSIDQIHFNQSLSNLLANDRERAAQEIEIVSQYLGMIKDGGKASVGIDGVWSLGDTVSKLNTLASEVRDGKAGESDLRKTFSNASLSIAAAQQNLASDSLAKDKQVMAGYCLRMSAGAFQHAIAWSGQSPDATTREAIHNAQQSGRALVGTMGENAAARNSAMKSDQVSSNSADNDMSKGNGMDQSAQTAGARVIYTPEQTQQAVQQLGSQITTFATAIKSQENWPANTPAAIDPSQKLSNDRPHNTPPDSNAFGR